MATKVDNIIIGAGPGGYELAAELSRKGESVLIAERDALGGTCLNRGCIPTKSLCASASAVIDAGFVTNLGIEYGDIKVDYAKITARVKDVVNGLRDGLATLLSKCMIVQGEAIFTSPNKIMIGDEVYEAPRIVIATGSKPAKLNIPGNEFAVTSDEILWLNSLPQSLAIIGGGVIGMELASIFSALGTKVYVIEYCREILPTIDAEISKRLRTTMSRRGIDIIVGSSVEKIENTHDNMHRVTYRGKKGETYVETEKVVMAVGRCPVVPNGFVEYGGKLTEKGFIEVDSMMRTNINGVFAIGDVNGLSMLAHSAYAQGRVVAYNNPDLFNHRYVPSVVYTHPEVATVGFTIDILEPYYVVKRPFASNGKACSDGHSEGLVKLVCSQEDNTILGITILGPHAADLMAEATILVTDGIKLNEVGKRYIHAHPTLSEIFA